MERFYDAAGCLGSGKPRAVARPREDERCTRAVFERADGLIDRALREYYGHVRLSSEVTERLETMIHTADGD